MLCMWPYKLVLCSNCDCCCCFCFCPQYIFIHTSKFDYFLFQVQFLIVFVHTAQIQFQPTCNFPKAIGLLLTFNAGLFTYMFSSFYIKSYNRKPSKSALDADDNKYIKQNGNGTLNGMMNGTVNGTVNGSLKNGLASSKEALNNNNNNVNLVNHNNNDITLPAFKKKINWSFVNVSGG